MKSQRLLVALTLVNLVVLIVTLAAMPRAVAEGVPPVLLSTSEEASGLSLAGPTNTRDTYVLLEARGTASSLKVKNENGREQIVKP